MIPGRFPGKPFRNIDRSWCKVRERAELKDVRIHDLRHSFASRALALGESLPMIGKLLGHTRVQTTARYAHLAEDSVERIGAEDRSKHRRGHSAAMTARRLSRRPGGNFGPIVPQVGC